MTPARLARLRLACCTLAALGAGLALGAAAVGFFAHGEPLVDLVLGGVAVGAILRIASDAQDAHDRERRLQVQRDDAQQTARVLTERCRVLQGELVGRAKEGV